MTVIGFPTKAPAAKAPAAKAPAAKADSSDDPDTTIADLRIEHVTYPLWVEGKFMGQTCNATNVMFEQGGKQKSSRFHHHLSQHEARAMVERLLRRAKK